MDNATNLSSYALRSSTGIEGLDLEVSISRVSYDFVAEPVWISRKLVKS